ncbi:hypothetical protein Bbelb_260500, partial [Branchiostoma belcheri]
CTTVEFRCTNSSRCVAPSAVCDGVIDCDDASDELLCQSCAERGLWQCESGECIKNAWVCDGDKDCSSGTDEQNCHTPCHGLQLECNGGCLPRYRACDGLTDCSNGEDEINCTDGGCGAEQFSCTDGTCLLESQLCDNLTDCSGGEDEEDCGGHNVGAHVQACPGYNSGSNPDVPPPGFPLGLTSRYIPDVYVNASSEYKSEFAPFQARHTPTNNVPGYCWVPSSVVDQWFQVSHGHYLRGGDILPRKGVVISGGGWNWDLGSWVTSFTLAFSMDGASWAPYVDSSDDVQVFQGNRDRYNKVSRPLSAPVTSRYIRLYPTGYAGWVAMVIEVYVTNDENTWLKQDQYVPLGVGLDPDDPAAVPKVPDLALRASSRRDDFYPWQARLNSGEGQQQGACWSPALRTDTEQWLQIKHGRVYKVAGVITQGAYNMDYWVTSYKLAFSINGEWTIYGTRDSNEMVFQGNSDSHRYARNMLDHPTFALYTRFYPLSFKNRIALRIEILVIDGSGCASQSVFCNRTCRPRESLCPAFDGCVPRAYNYGDKPICEDVLQEECGLATVKLEHLRCLVLYGDDIATYMYGSSSDRNGYNFSTVADKYTPASYTDVAEIDLQFSSCGDDELYHDSLACDGTEDCSTGEDETNCDECAMECLTVLSDTCIPTGWICDELQDCLDGRDEQGCVQGIGPTAGRIARRPQAGGRSDSREGRDRGRCGIHRVPKHCFFTCGDNVTCLPTSQLGDGRQDCAGGEDERPSDIEEVMRHVWGSCRYNCRSVYGNASCVPDVFVCDGDADCSEEEDEQGCEDKVVPTLALGVLAKSAAPLSNSEDSRTNLEKKRGSSVTVVGSNPGPPGPEGFLLSPPVSYKGSNHRDCGTFYCSLPGSADPYCVHGHLICDGYPDCAAGEDERGCGGNPPGGMPTQAGTTPSIEPTAETTSGRQGAIQDQTGMSLTHIYAHIPGNPWEDPEDLSAPDGPTFCDPGARSLYTQGRSALVWDSCTTVQRVVQLYNSTACMWDSCATVQRVKRVGQLYNSTACATVQRVKRVGQLYDSTSCGAAVRQHSVWDSCRIVQRVGQHGNMLLTRTSLVLLWSLCHCLPVAFALTGGWVETDPTWVTPDEWTSEDGVRHLAGYVLDSNLRTGWKRAAQEHTWRLTFDLQAPTTLSRIRMWYYHKRDVTVLRAMSLGQRFEAVKHFLASDLPGLETEEVKELTNAENIDNREQVEETGGEVRLNEVDLSGFLATGQIWQLQFTFPQIFEVMEVKFFQACSGFEKTVCTDGDCDVHEVVCDGIVDCDDGSDEQNCDKDICPNGAAINKTQVCDGTDDCGDNTDEQHCCERENKMACDNGQCLDLQKECNGTDGEARVPCGDHTQRYSRCDGIEDCSDGSDESCLPAVCDNGALFHPATRCNGRDDCGDNSDEKNCDCYYLQDKGTSYRGRANRDHSCQFWTSQYPHAHNHTPEAYPSAGLERNYCRNPRPDGKDGPWCYTNNPAIRWMYCDDVFACDALPTRCFYAVDKEEATQGPAGDRLCQRWDSQSPHSHPHTPQAHPDAGLEENFCRNPDNKARPWCYTTDPTLRWNYCNVMECAEFWELGPEFWELELKFWELELKFWELGPEFWELELEFWELELEFWELELEFWELEPEFWELELEFWELEPEFWELELEFWELEPEFWELELEFWELEPEFWELEPEFWELEPEFWEEFCRIGLIPKGSSMAAAEDSFTQPITDDYHLWQCVAGFIDKPSYWLVADCPDQWTDDVTRDQCLKQVDPFLPSDLIYRMPVKDDSHTCRQSSSARTHGPNNETVPLQNCSKPALTFTSEEFQVLPNGSVHLLSSNLTCPAEQRQSVGSVYCSISLTTRAVGRQSTEANQGWLTLGLVIVSVVAVLGFVIHTVRSGQWKKVPEKLKVQMTTCMAAAEVMFVLRVLVPPGPGCIVFAILLHYLLLTAFTSMNALSMDLFLTFRDDLDRAKLYKYVLYTWMVPALVVVATVIVEFGSSVRVGYGDSCWIGNPMGSLVAFGVPVFCALLVNVVLVTSALVAIRKSFEIANAAMSRSQSSKAWVYLRISFLMGLTWILGFIYPYVNSRVVEYIFIVMNASQGLLMTVTMTLTGDVLEKWKSAIRACFGLGDPQQDNGATATVGTKQTARRGTEATIGSATEIPTANLADVEENRAPFGLGDPQQDNGTTATVGTQQTARRGTEATAGSATEIPTATLTKPCQDNEETATASNQQTARRGTEEMAGSATEIPTATLTDVEENRVHPPPPEPCQDDETTATACNWQATAGKTEATEGGTDSATEMAKTTLGDVDEKRQDGDEN